MVNDIGNTSSGVRNKNSTSINFAVWASLILFGLLSHVFSVTVNAPAQISILISPIIFLIAIVSIRRFPTDGRSLVVYVYVTFWAMVSIFSSFVSGSPSQLAQIGIYSLLPITFFFIGFFASPTLLIRVLRTFLYLLLLFTITERILFYSESNYLGIMSLSLDMRSFNLSPGRDPLVGRAVGLFKNPNELGFVAGSLSLLVFFLQERRGLTRFLPIISGFILVFLSGSKGSLISMSVALILILPIFLSSGKKLLKFFSGATIILIFLSLFGEKFNFFFYARFGDLFSSTSSSSARGRYEFWTSVFEMKQIAFGTIVSPEMILGHAIDSFYVRVLAQTGILGIAFTLCVFFIFFMTALYLKDSRLKFSATAFLMFSFINSFTMMGYFMPAGVVIFWIGIGQMFVARSLLLSSRQI